MAGVLDTYATTAEAAADRAAQRQLLDALDAAKNALRLDGCGAWRINGRRGHIYTWGPSRTWLLYCRADTQRKWRNLQRRLSFCQVTQDGDHEGCFRLMELPTSGQAARIRKALGISKRGKVTAEAVFSAALGVKVGPPARANVLRVGESSQKRCGGAWFGHSAGMSQVADQLHAHYTDAKHGPTMSSSSPLPSPC